MIDLSGTSIKDFLDLVEHHISNFGSYLGIYVGRTDVSVYHTNVENLDSSYFIF